MYSAWTYCKFFQISYIWCKYWAKKFLARKTQFKIENIFSKLSAA
jgi:hypothetical protein